MLWIKSFHLIFVVMWFAGLLYLPRLFVYHAMSDDGDVIGIERFKVMERKLFAITTVGGIGALDFRTVAAFWWCLERLLDEYLVAREVDAGGGVDRLSSALL